MGAAFVHCSRMAAVTRHRVTPAPTYNLALIVEDMTKRGWEINDLAREAGKHHSTIRRFLAGERQRTKTAKAIAEALKRPVSRYLLGVTEAA